MFMTYGLGEPRNCWLPLDEMTVNGDRNYFKSHPEYHPYHHPEKLSNRSIVMKTSENLKPTDLRSHLLIFLLVGNLFDIKKAIGYVVTSSSGKKYLE